MEQPPVGRATHEEIAMMQEWAKAYGASVRQRSERQETTMARAGTLPDYLYQKEVPVSDKIILTSDSSTAEPVTTADSNANAGDSSTPDPAEPDSTESDELSEYDSSSDEEEPEENLPAEESDNLVQLSRDVDFLVGVTLWFGRPVRFNDAFNFLTRLVALSSLVQVSRTG